ncbi:protein LAZ1 homolog 1-like [Actinidia eriantha]|uniref:protein LAZ1 homolog 1-like n=1 Tax=Actinidia eriantha TaxID=165200 RepID=UPI00258D8FA2|nr:protein LAZ1 homolog 1-like [Actinidia eriantha]
MESQSLVPSSIPLLEEAYAYGVVEHPFPLNCLLRDWYPYLVVVPNFSQTWALYCLVQLYAVTKSKLALIKPLAKFLTFKSIIFLTWWQGLAVAFLFSIGAFKGALAQELKTHIQDYIICIEIILSQEKRIQKLNELVHSLQEQLLQCKEKNEAVTTQQFL